ncbi:MAG: hypothetical protein M0R48_11650 [Candidatus Omnitrophica bacterium]|nr:hypothetical protein [Candidatus Omnitrophota bacterium]
MKIIFPWSKIIVCNSTAMIFLASLPTALEPQHYNGYFFRKIEPVSFLFFDIPFLWKNTGYIWMPKNESEFEICFLKDYPDLRRRILPCIKCLWYTPCLFYKGKGYCYFDGDEVPVGENETCMKWSCQ